ncbi:MAG: hypothetical protein U0704_08770 [Candidatus Eisenbacteria bacterium]
MSLALLPALAHAIAGNGKLQIHHIDVGQGDGLLLISPNGQTALFDSGNYLSCTGIKNYLQGLGITTVDYHFLSHYHSDHLGCIDDLAAIGITIGTAGYDRGYSYSSGTYTAYVNTLGAKRQTMVKNQVVTLDAGSANPVTIKCVDVNGAGVYSVNGSDENAKSLDLLVSYGNFQEEIGGDLTGDPASSNDVETTVGPEVGQVEVYKAHHHGSRYSNNDNWLNALQPKVCVISCGNGNTYGHPTLDALNRMHAHNVHTYWTETGNGAAPNASWDKVAGGTVVIQAQPGPGAAFTVTGPGINDSYTNDGVLPPIHATEFAEGATTLKGSITTGDYTRMAVSDDSRMSVGAGVTSGNYWTDWYGSCFLDHVPLNLTVTYEGGFTISRTQTLYVWNWTTSAWVQVNSATVSTTDVVKTWTTASPAAYVGPSREVRFRVLGSTNAGGSYTSRGDLMKFEYDYTPGTAPAMLAALAPVVVPHVEDEHEHVHADAVVASAERRPAVDPEHVLPQTMLRRLDAQSSPAGVELTWTIGVNEHADGFNVYRQETDGTLVFVGNESELEIEGPTARFRFVDPATAGMACTGTYWLGVRSCSGPEGMIGPIQASTAGALVRIAFAAAPNPARMDTRFQFAVGAPSRARLDVLDLQGRLVATPFEGLAEVGLRSVAWNLKTTAGTRAAEGVYFARLVIGGRTSVVRFAVVHE